MNPKTGQLEQSLENEMSKHKGQPSGEIDGEMLEMKMKEETVEMREKQVATFEGALNFFYDAVESFLLDYKELAFRSTFLEPVKFYLAAMGRSEDSGEVQRVRLWANKLLVEDGSVAIAQMPDFWSCLSQEAWEEFTAVTSLGLPFQDLDLEGVTVSAKEPLEMTEVPVVFERKKNTVDKND
eukprot:symbB.v1.2.022311.t1/scaffold1921.1/size96030/1